MHALIGGFVSRLNKHNDLLYLKDTEVVYRNKNEKSVVFYSKAVTFKTENLEYWQPTEIVEHVIHVENEFADNKQHDAYVNAQREVYSNLASYFLGCGFLFGIRAGTPTILRLPLYRDLKEWEKWTDPITPRTYHSWAHEKKMKIYRFMDEVDKFQQWHIEQEEEADCYATRGDQADYDYAISVGSNATRERKKIIERLRDYPLCGLTEKDINNP